MSISNASTSNPLKCRIELATRTNDNATENSETLSKFGGNITDEACPVRTATTKISKPANGHTGDNSESAAKTPTPQPPRRDPTPARQCPLNRRESLLAHLHQNDRHGGDPSSEPDRGHPLTGSFSISRGKAKCRDGRDGGDKEEGGRSRDWCWEVMDSWSRASRPGRDILAPSEAALPTNSRLKAQPGEASGISSPVFTSFSARAFDVQPTDRGPLQFSKCMVM
jgi:hypothetical protein